MDEPGSHWTKARARALLAEWKQSGGSLSRFARERGIRARRLYWWRQRLSAEQEGRSRAKRGARPKPVSIGTELKLAPAVLLPAPTSVSPVVLRIGPTIVLEINATESVTPSWVTALVRELVSVS